MQGSLSSLSNSIAAKIRGEYNNDNINSHNTFYKMGYEYFFFIIYLLLLDQKDIFETLLKSIYIHVIIL